MQIKGFKDTSMTSGNPILDKNLESIARYNPALKEKLLNLPYLTNDIQLIETDLNEPNLSYNGLPLHSQQGAEAEAKEIFDKTEDAKLFTHFILGIGLGHLFKEFCERSKGNIILYESNLEILRVTLELADFSKELSQVNVRVASDEIELRNMYYSTYEYKSLANFALLNSYMSVYGAEAQKVLDRIEFIAKSIFSDYALLRKDGTNQLLLTLDNLLYTLNSPPIGALKDLYKGKTALIVSAGPTLDQNIETIKKNREKVVIFCVGTAFKSLMKNGIIPDFLNVMESFECSGQVKGFDLSDINIILDACANGSFYKLKTKQKFIYPQKLAPWGKYWCALTGVDPSPYYTCGTVSSQALHSAKMLGIKTIILVGQDFAFVNNSCYSQDSAYSDLVFEMNQETGIPEYKIKNFDSYVQSLVPAGTDITEQWCVDFASSKIKSLNDSQYFIKGIKGDMLPTDRGYAVFSEHFKEVALNNPDIKFINTSLIGAQIDGFENIPLDVALEKVLPIVEKVKVKSSFKHNKKQIIQKLKNDKQILEDISKEIKKAQGYICKYEKELKLRKTLTAAAVKCCHEFTGIYRNIYATHFQNNFIFNTVALAANVELEYIIYSMKDSDKEKSIEIWYDGLKQYYVSVGPAILPLIAKLEENIDLLEKEQKVDLVPSK